MTAHPYALTVVIPVYRGAASIGELVDALAQLDIPGGHGKVPIGPDYLRRDADGGWRVRDPAGRGHPYPPRR